MTNKLPVVGKRYKLRNQLGSGNGDIVMVVSVGKDLSCKIYFEKFDEISDEPLPLASFWNICEELPEDNLQETKKVQINEKGEVSEVERALEELKQAISKSLSKITCVNDVDKITFKLMDVRKAAQNLVNALELESSKPITPEVGCGKKAYDEWIEACKKEPEIDMKEECVEPVSIWKNGDELEELEKRNEKFLVRTKDGRVTMPFLGNIFTNDRQIDKNIKEATTLTDFINSFEEMQKDIAELKKCQK